MDTLLHELGNKHDKTIVMIHGTGMSWDISYGCRVLMEVLQDKRLTIITTIADGMPTREYPDIRSELLRELYLLSFTGMFFIIMGRAGKLRKRFLAKITGRTIEEAERVLYTKATWKSWKHQDECLIGYHTNYAAFQRTDAAMFRRIRKVVKGKNVLEVATGPGVIAKQVADEAKSMIATDFSEKMLAVARRGEVPENLVFEQADACGLPYEDDSYGAYHHCNSERCA